MDDVDAIDNADTALCRGCQDRKPFTEMEYFHYEPLHEDFLGFCRKCATALRGPRIRLGID